MTDTPSDAALQALAEAATPGPWVRSGVQQKHLDQHGPYLAVGPDGVMLFFSPLGHSVGAQAQCIRDLDFVAHANPATILRLLDDLANERALRENAEAALKGRIAQDEALLPCDVLVAPATIIRAGVSFSTLRLAIERRRDLPSDVPTPTVTVFDELNKAFAWAKAAEAEAKELREALKAVVGSGALFTHPTGEEMTTHPRTKALRKSISWQLSVWAVRDETISAIASALGGPDALEQVLEGWRPIETAPRDGTAVLLWGNGPTCAVAQWDSEASIWSDGGWDVDATHWRPLPSPPTGKE